MTPLLPRLKARIAATGPLSVAEYMTECLHNPEHGYYAQSAVLGAAGDFVTAPEISQTFGELVGLALAQTWLDQGSPAPAALVELGPGRGTLMADVRRATARLPGFTAAMRVHLVEASPRLRQAQRNALGSDVVWHDGVTTLPDLPTFAIANEFFDALPIRQFVRRDHSWAERVVGLREDALTFGLTPPAPQADLSSRLEEVEDGGLVERPTAGPNLLGDLAATVARRGGVVFVVDYGDLRSRGDTLQAVAGHRKVHPLQMPGAADLSAHVDFEPLALAATKAGLTAAPLATQGAFLEALGIGARTEALAASVPEAMRSKLWRAHRRLTHADEMGTLFKVAAYRPPHAPPPPGTGP